MRGWFLGSLDKGFRVNLILLLWLWCIVLMKNFLPEKRWGFLSDWTTTTVWTAVTPMVTSGACGQSWEFTTWDGPVGSHMCDSPRPCHNSGYEFRSTRCNLNVTKFSKLKGLSPKIRIKMKRFFSINLRLYFTRKLMFLKLQNRRGKSLS